MIPALTPPPVLAAPGSAAALDVNQVIGDTTAVPECNGGAHDAGRDKVKNERYGVAFCRFWPWYSESFYILIIHRHPATPDSGIPTIGLPGFSAPSAEQPALNHSGKVIAPFAARVVRLRRFDHRHPLPCVLSTTSTITPPFTQHYALVARKSRIT